MSVFHPKIPKYFDSPEGQEFLENNPQASKPASSKRPQSQTADTVVIAKELKTPEPVIETAPPPETVKQTDTKIIPIILESATGDCVDLSTPLESQDHKKPMPKPKKVKLPKSILGSKPGVAPNTEYINRESETLRKVNTASTSVANRLESTYNLIKKI
jgi:hypothetical protein